MKVNINQRCSVVLKKRGVEAYNEYYKNLGIKPHKEYNVGDVYTSELWDIMHIFGPYCFIGPIPPFETDIEISEKW